MIYLRNKFHKHSQFHKHGQLSSANQNLKNIIDYNNKIIIPHSKILKRKVAIMFPNLKSTRVRHVITTTRRKFKVIAFGRRFKAKP